MGKHFKKIFCVRNSKSGNGWKTCEKCENYLWDLPRHDLILGVISFLLHFDCISRGGITHLYVHILWPGLIFQPGLISVFTESCVVHREFNVVSFAHFSDTWIVPINVAADVAAADDLMMMMMMMMMLLLLLLILVVFNDDNTCLTKANIYISVKYIFGWNW